MASSSTSRPLARPGAAASVTAGRTSSFDVMTSVHVIQTATAATNRLSRSAGWMLVELLADQRVIGFVRYTLTSFPDSDLPHPEIGFGLWDPAARGQGLAAEAVGLLIEYLLAGYPAERISAVTDVENLPAQHLLEGLDFRREGIIRRAMFRDGRWCDLALYGLLRDEWHPRS